MSVRLTLACGDYDINGALASGAVTARGLSLTVLVLPSPERHARMTLHREFDICELSMATYLMTVDQNPEDLIAVPAFPHRRFRHGFIFVGNGSAITDPRQLNGTRIGLRTWQTTAGLWARGILQDDHDVDLTSIEWITQDAEDIPLRHADAYRISRAPAGRTVVEMLIAGELDALIYPELPAAASDGRLRTLFADPKAAELEYHARSGIFPIMHTVVIRRQVVADQPWVPREILHAFRASKDRAFAAMRDPRRVSLAWWREALAEQERILGPDPWAYDFASSVTTLTTLIRYAREQGLISRVIRPDELFSPSTLDELPAYV